MIEKRDIEFKAIDLIYVKYLKALIHYERVQR